MKTALLYSLIPVAASLLAVLVAILLKESGRLQSIVQHLADGGGDCSSRTRNYA